MVCAATAALLAGSATASIPSHPYLEPFGSAAQPTFSQPASVAIDQGTGEVYVADLTAKTVSRFDATGNPVPFSALGGSNVIDGVGGSDETPQHGILSGFEPSEVEIAIDESGGATDGNIYVTDSANLLVDAFASSGAYLGQLSEYKQGADASGPLAHFGESCGVAVDASGTVYTGDYNGYVHKFVPSGAYPVNGDNTANFSNSSTCQVAAGSGPTAGYVFAASYGSNLWKINATTGLEQGSAIADNARAVSVDPGTGHVYVVFTAVGGGGFSEFDAGSGNASLVSKSFLQGGNAGAGIAVRGSTGEIYASPGTPNSTVGIYDSSLEYEELPVATKQATDILATRATVHGTVDPSESGETVTDCKFEYGTVESGAFAESMPCAESIPPGSPITYVSAALQGLSSNTEYQFRLVVTTPHVVSTSEASTFTTLRRVRTAPASDIGTSTATLNGAAKPEGESLTTCRFEYGTTTSYGSIVPCSEAVPADFGSHDVSAPVSGLESGTVYHFRLVVGDSSETIAGQDEAFTTEGQAGLPDNRAYEQVSPVDKNESDVNFSADMASTGGNKMAFLARGAFAGAPTAQGVQGNPYLATRGPNGWSTESTSLPTLGEINNGSGYYGYAPDLSKGVIRWLENSPQQGTYDPTASPGFNLYMRDNAAATFRLLNGSTDVGHETEGFLWGSSDFSHLALDTPRPLTEDAPCTERFEHEHCAYEWVEGTLRVASVLPDETKVPGTVGGPGESCNFEHAMSDDGSRLFFTYMFFGVLPRDLYARTNGTTSTLISGSERTLPGGASGYQFNYQSAEAAHGDKVLFSTKNSLVDADTDETGDLYLYDFSKPEGERLTLVSEDQNPAAPQGASVPEAGGFGCLSVVGTSEDLKRIYYVADNQILPGEPEDTGPKLYLWDDTGGTAQTTYIGTLSGANDALDWGVSVNNGTPQMRHARWSANGRYLAFPSSAQLTSFENEEREEMYRYDAVAHELDCLSCTADSLTEGPPLSEDEVGFNTVFYTKLPMNHQLRNVSEDGKVFFQSLRSLLPRDSNGKQDVYEYENGHLHLISRGTGTDDSYFLDASPSGNDVFFLTRDKLVGWDVDNNRDAYDARVGGGFPEPPPEPPACEGDACQPPPNVPNDQTPSSASFKGPGNPKVARHRRCARKQKHKGRGHGKRRRAHRKAGAHRSKLRKPRCAAHRKKHRSHRRHHRRHSTRSHG
ncbi:MAG TPA: hypothetical protein VFI09_02455 [Solirubrobacterales bacterium]|nr:hypothetical protein [Solirubrobacterales bacterium]